MVEKYYSSNEETYEYSDPEGAIESVLECMKAPAVGNVISIWVGDCTTQKASHYTPDIVDDMSNAAYDACDEFAGGWPHSTAEQENELNAAIQKVVDEWADKHGLQPKFGTVSNCKEIKFRLTKVDLENWDINYEQLSESA